MVVGLLITSFSLFLETRIGAHTGYGLLLPSFIVMGLGMALVMSPMSTAGMNSVPPQKAGVASGILSMSRMVGGTFGVAAIGALFQHLARSRLTDELAGTGVTAAQRDKIVENLGSAHQASGMPPEVVNAAKDAFIHALSSGMWLSAGVALFGAVIAFTLIAPKAKEAPDAAESPQAAAEVEAASV